MELQPLVLGRKKKRNTVKPLYSGSQVAFYIILYLSYLIDLIANIAKIANTDITWKATEIL